MTDIAPAWLAALLWASFYGSLLSLGVLALGPLLRRQLPARWRFALWLMVLIRFAPLPMPGNPWSILNLVPAGQAAIQPPPTVPLDVPPAHPIPSEVAIAVSADASAPQGAAAHAPSPTPILQHPAITPSAAHHWNGSRLLQVLYLTGAGIVLLRLALATRALRRIIAGATPVQSGPLLNLLQSVQRTLGTRGPLPLLATMQLASPALAGFWRPRLLMPADLLSSLSPDELRLVFMHEVAHLRRRDVLVNYALALLQAAHWFNPLFWLILPRIRAERELACDELVLEHTIDPAPYGHALLKLFQSAGPARLLAPAVGIVESRHFFARRIRMIATFKRRPAWLALPVLLTAALIGACVMTGPLSRAQTPTPRPENPPAAASAPATAAPTSDPATVENRLAEPIREFRFNQQPLALVLNKFAEITGLNLHVNWKTLQNISVEQETPVSIQLTNVPARKVLQLLLDDLGAQYQLDDGVISISTAVDIQRLTSNAPADITPQELQDRLQALKARDAALSAAGAPSPALDAAQHERDRMLQDLVTRLAASQNHAAPATPPVLRVYDVHELLDVPEQQQGVLTADQQSAMKDLVQTLMTTLNNPACTLSAFNGMIIANAPPDLHDKLREVLENLNVAHRQYRDEMRQRVKAANESKPPQVQP